MNATELRSEDRRFGLALPASALDELRRLCARAGSVETGGILVGFYSPNGDMAVVTRVTGPPRDSTAGATWFQRGTHALTGQLASVWSKGEFYLGEWHYHPGAGPPVPSHQDCKQLEEIARSKQYHCPEPVLVIAALPDGERLSLATFVFPQGRSKIPLNAAPTRVGEMEGPEPGHSKAGELPA